MIQTVLHSFDQRWFLRLNQYHHPVTDIFFSLITSSFFWIPLYIWLVFFIKNSLGWRGLLLFIFTLVLSDQTSATWLKPLFAQYRPCCMMPISQLHLVGTYKGIYGCPSSHATNTYAFAMLFWRLFKKQHPLSYLFFIWATVVSYGRIYGGMHYPLDIWLGAMLGCYIGLLMEKLYQKSSQRHK